MEMSLHDLIATHEEWLMHRVLMYARENGYTAYTSTLQEAWRASITGLSAPIVAALRSGEGIQGLAADREFATDPIARFGVEEARKHRERGVTFVLFLGLMKYYRKSYLDLLGQAEFTSEKEAASADLLDNFFDRIELGFSSEWLKQKQAELIGELQQTNLQITNEKNKFLTIFESLPNPALFVDSAGMVANLNRAADSLFYPGKTAARNYYGQPRPDLPPPLRFELETFRKGAAGVASFEKEFETAEGGRQYIIIMQRMLDVSGKFSGTVIILNDVSHLKRLEEEIELLNTDLADRAFQLERVNKELEAFNYTVSHDLRSPLTGISGYCQLLLGTCRDQLDEPCRDYVKEIVRICTRMNQFITTMLDFSCIATFELKRELVNMSALARSIAGNLKMESDSRQVEFVIPSGITADGDPRLLRVVLDNLLGNAWKFTAKKERARVEFGCREQSGGPVYFVKDNGEGFDMARAEDLFSPFQRLHGKEYGGFGVGLASVERIVMRHGGRVWAEGEPEKGATIFFTVGRSA